MRAVATFNTGSSSVKFALFALTEDGAPGEALLRGNLADLHGTPRLKLSGADVDPTETCDRLVRKGTDAAHLIPAIARWLAETRPGIDIAAAGHRIVHGGLHFSGPVKASPDVLARLDGLTPFAPSHQPHNLTGVRALDAAMPGLVQTLSFDTAFHRTAPHVAQLYALPRSLSEEGIIRYGFHGLSFAHISRVAGEVFGSRPERLIALHLGSGASACGMRNGTSVATSMGLTALDGLMMATRCGDLDPGVVLHLIQDRGLPPGEVADLLYQQSGLLGVSGISADMKTLLDSDAPEAREAVDLYVYRITREVGALAAALGGFDALVFTGGVGENAAIIREKVCASLGWLGLELDAARNAEGSGLITSDPSPVAAAIIPADEETVIAEEAASILTASDFR